jgi:hypothetical protein
MTVLDLLLSRCVAALHQPYPSNAESPGNRNSPMQSLFSGLAEGVARWDWLRGAGATKPATQNEFRPARESVGSSRCFANAWSLCNFRLIISNGFSTTAAIGVFRRTCSRLCSLFSDFCTSGAMVLSYRRTLDSGILAGHRNAANRIRPGLPALCLFFPGLQRHVASAIERAASYEFVARNGLSVLGARCDATYGAERRHLWHLPEHGREPDRLQAARLAAPLSNQLSIPALFRSSRQVEWSGTRDAR